jgi:hypothetical protein
MDRQNLFKQLPIINTNKMEQKKNINNNIEMISFKNFEGKSSFQANVDIENKNKEDVIKILDDSKNNKRYYFEWTDYQSKVKPFYDIDLWFEKRLDVCKNIPKVKNQVTDVLNKLYPDARMAVSSSHGAKQKKGKDGWAISFHFVLFEYECSIQELREFNEKNNLYDIDFKEIKGKMFDKGVYRDGGNMRCLYSYKPNDDRQKIPETYKDDYCAVNHLIQSCSFTNQKRMGLPESPPVTPPSTDEDNNDDDDFFPIELPKKEYNLEELKEILDILGDDCYEYDDWTKIGMSLHNITDGNEIGFGLYNEWSKKDDGYDGINELKKKWESFGKKKTGNKVGLTYLRKLKEKYTPKNYKSLQDIYMNALTNKDNGEGRGKAKIEMLKEMNNRLMYIKKTSNFVVPTIDTIINYDDEGNMINTKQKDTYEVKAIKDVKLHFQKEVFDYSFTDEDGKHKTIKMNPLNEWLSWIDRNEKEKIDFDPRNIDNPYIFNIWKGYNITKEMCEDYNEEDAEPVLNHIKEIWCSGEEDQYEYVMNYLAHIIQKPWVKTAVCLALHSKQGAGKGVILKKLENIIGDNHYSQNSNAERVFGKFNGLLEGKTLINLDEAFWGGDKKLEGQIKNHITEDKQTVEKKTINQYNIHDFCNYIITTNNDWFAGIEEGDRRYYCLELLNKFAGRSNAENEAYFNKIRMVPTEAFAKVLYNRDISQFNPRKFKKTALAQEQVERNHNSPKVWWNTVMRDGGFEYDGNFIDWGQCLKVNTGGYSSKKYGLELTDKKTGEKIVVYDKEWIFKCYDSKNYDGRKFCNNTFWKEIQKNCLGKKLYREEKIQRKKQRRIYVFLPSLEDARQAWYDYQEYDYGYGNNNNIEDEYDFSDDSDEEW